jgi:ABC-type nitrate/sulfonate/bicarbonate transport system permease component
MTTSIGSTAIADQAQQASTIQPAAGPIPGQQPVPFRTWIVRRLLLVAPVLVVIAVVLGGWQLYIIRAHPDTSILPGPLRILRSGWADRANLWSNTLPTLKETLIGFALSITVGWLLAIICDFSKLLRRGLEPLLVASQTIPIIAIAPLFVIWFGFTTLPKILIVALTTFFSITVSLLQGFATTPVEATNLLRSMGASRVQRFVRVRVPTAMPYFFSGLRIAITYAVIGAIFGEYVGAERGLGIYMQISKNSRRTDLVLAAVAVSAVLSLGLYFIVTVIERLSIPWSEAARGRGRR